MPNNNYAKLAGIVPREKPQVPGEPKAGEVTVKVGKEN